MSDWWDNIRHFRPSEFDSPDKPGSGKENMKRVFISNLDQAREDVGKPFIITSGYRTPEHNRTVEGVSSSAHLKGWAADIQAQGSRMKYELVHSLMNRGMHRFGIGDRFVHVDCDPDKDPDVIWTY